MKFCSTKTPVAVKSGHGFCTPRPRVGFGTWWGHQRQALGGCGAARWPCIACVALVWPCAWPPRGLLAQRPLRPLEARGAPPPLQQVAPCCFWGLGAMGCAGPSAQHTFKLPHCKLVPQVAMAMGAGFSGSKIRCAHKAYLQTMYDKSAQHYVLKVELGPPPSSITYS